MIIGLEIVSSCFTPILVSSPFSIFAATCIKCSFVAGKYLALTPSTKLEFELLKFPRFPSRHVPSGLS